MFCHCHRVLSFESLSLSQSLCHCHRTHVIVRENMSLSHNVDIVTEIMSLSQRTYVIVLEFMSLSQILCCCLRAHAIVTELISLSQGVCHCHRTFLSQNVCHCHRAAFYVIVPERVTVIVTERTLDQHRADVIAT